MVSMRHLEHVVRSGTFLMAFLFMTAAAYGQVNCLESKQGLHATQKSSGSRTALWPLEILHQHITLNLTLGNTIAGSCRIIAVPREEGLSSFPLHLLQLTVDSVVGSAGPLAFTHASELLEIALGGTFGTADTLDITVFYQGTPTVDPSGFGGFYNTGTYTYNLGVAFQSIPHSYGRAWFPCVDNFTERNSYEFTVMTAGGRNAWCNGELVQETQLGGDTLIRHWLILETMPAYLASVASSNYAVMRDTFPSLGGLEIPVALVARPPDTTNMKNSFVNLQAAFDHFEQRFGAYSWNKVGYVLTPQGAMEHSTSIHYPQFIANGSLTYEDVMAHELAHQWWGNLVTCERAEEMYINEGFAEYLSFLFLEYVYGPGRYRNVVRTNHRKMVHRAHLLDQGWWALADVPQQWTYGEHSYNKGADVLHAMRAYMGNEAFNNGLRSFLETHAFQAVNSEQLRNHLSSSTGIDMSDFFADRIFQPGWAAFEVDSFTMANNTLHVDVQQKLRGASSFYNNVPLTVALVAADGTTWTAPERVVVGGEFSSFSIANIPFTPVAVVLDPDEGMSLAITLDRDTITQATIRTYANADLRLNYSVVPEPFDLLLQEYWVAADEDADDAFAYRISPDRWWRVVGHIPEGTQIVGRITYDGRPTTTGSLDIGLMQDHGDLPFREDSLVVLYRPDQRSRWSLHPDFTVSPLNNVTDKSGRVDFNGVWAGEYVLAWRKSAVGIAEGTRAGDAWTLYPNPAKDHVLVNGPAGNGTLELLDSQGRVVRRERWQRTQQQFNLAGLGAGHYTMRSIDEQGRTLHIGPLVIER